MKQFVDLDWSFVSPKSQFGLSIVELIHYVSVLPLS